MTNYIADLNHAHPSFRRDAERLAVQVSDSAHSTVIDGVIRWTSNGSVPPADIVALAVHVGQPVDVAKCNAARSADIAKLRAAMIANDRPMSREELTEARAAHGPGVRLVNMITGRVTVT